MEPHRNHELQQALYLRKRVCRMDIESDLEGICGGLEVESRDFHGEDCEQHPETSEDEQNTQPAKRGATKDTLKTQSHMTTGPARSSIEHVNKPSSLYAAEIRKPASSPGICGRWRLEEEGDTVNAR